MSSDFKLVNIVDSQLEDISTEITLPVITGSSSSTFQTVNCTSQSTSQIQFNVQIPSLATAFSRHVLCESKPKLRVDIQGGTTEGYWAENQVLFSYGHSNALQAFPLNSLLTTAQANINQSNVSVNIREIMPALLKLYNYTELSKYNSLTPSLIDSFYLNYADGVGSNNNVLGDYSVGSYSKEYQPRGVFSIKMTDPDGNTIPYDIRASAAGTAPFAYFYIEFKTTEPLLFLSPFISGSSNNQASLLGVNNMTVTLNVGNASRVMSNASFATRAGEGGGLARTISNVSLVSFSSSQLLFNFLTIPASLFSKIEPKNVLHYNSYTSYNTTSQSDIGVGESTTLTSNNIQLNQVPSKILLYVRKDQNTLNTYDSNSFMVIEKVQINFANKSGLLSSATQSQLYHMSLRNGLNMSFYEFSGEGVSRSAEGVASPVATIGSIIVIDPALDLSLDAQYTNMSSGQYNIQLSTDVKNHTSEVIKPNIYICVVNNGMFITENGISSFMTGMLNQEQVLDTKSKSAIIDSHTYHEEITGGSIENLGHLTKHLKLNYSRNSEKEKELDKPEGESAGSGMSGGSMSGGRSIAMPTSTMKKRIHKYM